MKWFLLTLLLTSFSVQADTKAGLLGSFSLNTFEDDVNTDGLDKEISVNLGIGFRILHDVNETIKIRTGLVIDEKSAEYSYYEGLYDGNIAANVIYLSMPLNIQVKTHEQFDIFGGYIPHVRLNDYCSEEGDIGLCSDVAGKSMVHYANVGASVHVNEKLDIDATYMHALTENIVDYKIHTFMVMGVIKF